MWLLIGMALAAEPPVVTVDPNGTVVGVVVVPAGEAAVRAFLADVKTEAALSPSLREVRIEPENGDAQDGACVRLRKKTRGLLRPFELVTRRCPTETGWREELVESADFASYALEWRLAAAEGGTRVEYRVTTTLTGPFPAAAVSAGVVDATATALVNLQDRAR